MASVYKVHEAKTHFSRLLAQVTAGEEIVIARGSEPVARMVPIDAGAAATPQRVPGTLKGKVWLDDTFFEPMSEEELRLWEDGPV